tara:strand:+ start:15441 stop:16697 length:1257 start_codon:yes stop_codon:yes gene_type:complete
MSYISNNLPQVSRRGYLSSQTGRQNVNTYNFDDVVQPDQTAVQNNFLIEPSSTRDLIVGLNGISNPCQTSNFNVIKVNVDSNISNSQQLILRINQGISQANMINTFTTYIDPDETLYRNYPVQSNFFNISLENTADASTATANVSVLLSKYTQYTTGGQNNDPIKRDQMISLERQTNDFEDDIALGYREDISIINRFGNLGNLSLKNDALVAPIDIVKNTSNVYSQINAYSDSVLDDFELIVSGDAIGEFGRLSNGLELAGTSNSSTSINVFKSVDTVVNLRNLDGSTATNTGNITVQRTNGQAIAYIPAQYANISAAQYYIKPNDKGVLREVGVRGSTALTGGRIIIRDEDADGQISVIWNQPINDGIVNARWNPDYTIDGGHTVYGAIENTDTSFDDNDLVVEIKIVNYNILEDIP